MADTVKGTAGIKWVAGKMMVGADSNGRTLVISGWGDRDPAWVGLKASDLLLLAAASCASYDVIEILAKQREPLESLETSCTGEQLSEPPFTFTSVHLRFMVRGAVTPAKLERAIGLSMDRYCSVVSTLRQAVEVTYDYELSE